MRRRRSGGEYRIPNTEYHFRAHPPTERTRTDMRLNRSVTRGGAALDRPRPASAQDPGWLLRCVSRMA